MGATLAWAPPTWPQPGFDAVQVRALLEFPGHPRDPGHARFAAPGRLGHSVSPGEDAGFAAAPARLGRKFREFFYEICGAPERRNI